MIRLLIFFMLTVFAIQVSADTSITINDFYKSASDFNWKDAAIKAGITAAALAAIGAVFLVVFPPAGFFLIGWSSVAAGGVTGAVLIGSALTFSTDIAFDYVYTQAKSEFDYRDFQESSKDIVNLPFPKNSDGSYLFKSVVQQINEALEDAGKELEYIQGTKNYSYHVSRIILKDKMLGLDEKEATLISVMLFIDDKYIEAKEISSRYVSKGYSNPLLMLIYSSSLLYMDDLDYDYSYDVFMDSIKALDDGSYAAMFYSVYFDRVFFRASSGNLDYDAYVRALNDLRELPYSNDRLGLQNAFFIRMLAAAKLEQQKIISIHEGSRSVWREPEVVEFMATSLDNHILLIESIYDKSAILGEEISHESESRLISRLNSTERATLESIEELDSLISDYRAGYEGLRVRISEVYEYANRGFIRRVFN